MARIIYFARLVDVLGQDVEIVDLPATVANVGELLQWLRNRGRPWETVLLNDAVTVTVNRQFADPDTPLTNHDEIALINARG